MWIGACVFVTDGAQEFFELYSKRKQAGLARGDEPSKKFIELVDIVTSVTEGHQILDSDKFALRIQPQVAKRLGLPEKGKAPSLSSIRNALREVKTRRNHCVDLNRK